MSGSRIVVKYHNRRMLLTVDLNALLDTLFDAYGDGVIVEFAEMNEREKAESIDAVEGLRAVRDRFRIYDVGSPSGARRREDLEQAAVAGGRK
jgi:hypothetical protein